MFSCDLHSRSIELHSPSSSPRTCMAQPSLAREPHPLYQEAPITAHTLAAAYPPPPSPSQLIILSVHHSPIHSPISPYRPKITLHTPGGRRRHTRPGDQATTYPRTRLAGPVMFVHHTQLVGQAMSVRRTHRTRPAALERRDLSPSCPVAVASGFAPSQRRSVSSGSPHRGRTPEGQVPYKGRNRPNRDHHDMAERDLG